MSRPKSALAAVLTIAPETPAWRRAVRSRLLRWYRAHARTLPWRGSHDPYAIWISEIMLQQTQVETVKPYFIRFMRTFPTIAALTAAAESEVLKLWEGLGYYRRARQLHAAARQIVADHGGVFPSDLERVRNLPGIGRYTAGAILSIAFDLRQPILEANTVRLYSRLLAWRDDPHGKPGQDRLWRFALDILPAKNSGAFNQALMELGSLVCTPRAPKCESCPLSAVCPTRRLGWQDRIPAPKQQPRFVAVQAAAIVVRRSGGKVLLRKCGPDERWAGLWDFLRFEVPDPEQRSLAEQVQKRTGLKVTIGSPFLTIKHGVTRFKITLACYPAEAVGGRLAQPRESLRWIKLAELADYPLSTTGRKIANHLRDLGITGVSGAE
ncbi:MAG TPA: A/G-specific adenine glycosylase [Pirellulales bacterium]|nr:A/G-specific adenine glycosylase [Pirellulales bacterium]